MLIFRLIAGLIINMAIFGTLLFLPAGTLEWWRAWVFLGVVFVCYVVMAISIFPGREDLLNERFKPPIQKGQPFADKIILILFIFAFLGLIVFIPLDVFRLHLLPKPGTLVSFLGLALFVAGWWTISLAMKENSFAVLVVEHQEERQQTVVATGVYSIVRHPMYAGAVLLMIGMPLWLESYAAGLLAILVAASQASVPPRQ